MDSRVDGRPLELDIAAHPGRLTLTIVGGTGMNPGAIERDYLRWGAGSKKGGDRIGRYGQGGKAAIGHLGNRFAVVASAAGDEHAYGFEDPAYRDRAHLRTYDLTQKRKPVAAALGYVQIEIGEVDRKIEPRRLAERLAETYRPLLVNGLVRMVVNHGPVVPRPWNLAEHHEVAVRAGGRLVRGWWGLLPDPPPPGAPDAGVRLFHLGRLVGEPDWFGHPTPAAHPALNRLVGEVELPHIPVTMNKSDVDRGSPEWAAVETRLRALLAPPVRKLTRQPASVVSPESLRTAEQVRRILAKALRLLEEGRLFETEVPAGGDAVDGAEGQLALEGVRAPKEATPDGSPEADAGDGDAPAGDEASKPGAPRLPKPGSAGGPGGRARRGIGEIVVRQLNSRTRSALVEEDGIKRIVINSAYPLFEVRRGDLWYQLETALREVCVTIPEATVPEFERKVNELMLVSLALADRRRPREGRPGEEDGRETPGRALRLSGMAAVQAVCYAFTRERTLERDMPLVRTNITLDADLLATIDEVAGPRGRSAWIAAVLEKEARRERMKKVWRGLEGALKGSTSWGATPEEVLETLRELRGSWDRPEVDALWGEHGSDAEAS